ncbi:MAG: response regulator [Cyanobacteria bacterium P01_F01_bin.86]
MNKHVLPVATRNVTEANDLRLFRTLEKLHFSGHLELTNLAGQKWDFYWLRGLIVHATGGTHAGRRWRRHLANHCPEIPIYVVAWQRDLDKIEASDFNINWEYTLLTHWLAEGRILHPQAAAVINGIVSEVLFDVAQSPDVSHQIWQDSSLSEPITGIEAGQSVASVLTLFKAWHKAGLSHISPNQAPIIRNQEQLKKLRKAKFYQKLTHILNTRHSLWDLAIKMQRHIMDVTTALMPCVRSGMLEMVDLPDLYVPKWRQKTPTIAVKQASEPSGLIACVDDSIWVRKMLEKLLTSAGYEFVGVSDELRAISTLLTRKPDLIFLDLVMPKANGYEICEQLRKLSRFRDTPIIILTGNDGYASRLRSNFAGASDFLSKPLDAEKVLTAIRKHLKEGVTS